MTLPLASYANVITLPLSSLFFSTRSVTGSSQSRVSKPLGVETPAVVTVNGA